MKNRTVLFTANAGFLLTVNGITLAVDAFPQSADRGFSALSSAHLEQLCHHPDLADIHYVIATHDHNDHYSKDWNEQFLSHHPQARFLGAVSEEQEPETRDPILLRSDHPTYYLPGITFEFLRLPHEGAAFADVSNFGCLVTFPAASAPCRILFLGDATPADTAIAQWIGDRPIDLAMLNFPWIALPKGRAFIEKYLPTARIGVIHLPYEDEDRNHYVAAARKAVTQWNRPDVTLLTEYGQEMCF